MRPAPSPILPRQIERVLTSRHIILRLILTTVALVIGLGILVAIVDEKDFPNVWIGMWWAIGTVATVGYGDVVPTQVSGRIIAAATMIVGIGFLSLITATVASVLVARANVELADRGEDEVMTALKRVEERLDRIERELGSGEGA
jgi:voltage-gated potassium channel